jgi:bacillithiol system protein YtxJ
MNQLFEIHELEFMNELIEKSHHEPVLIFKHSATCPVSAFAFLQLTSFLEGHKEHLLSGMVVVQQSREVSNEIASRLNLKHQSPQTLLIKNGHVTWHASHSNINLDSLGQVFERRSPSNNVIV